MLQNSCFIYKLIIYVIKRSSSYEADGRKIYLWCHEPVSDDIIEEGVLNLYFSDRGKTVTFDQTYDPACGGYKEPNQQHQ